MPSHQIPLKHVFSQLHGKAILRGVAHALRKPTLNANVPVFVFLLVPLQKHGPRVQENNPKITHRRVPAKITKLVIFLFFFMKTDHVIDCFDENGALLGGNVCNGRLCRATAIKTTNAGSHYIVKFNSLRLAIATFTQTWDQFSQQQNSKNIKPRRTVKKRTWQMTCTIRAEVWRIPYQELRILSR